MPLIADLHIHSRYSRATSPEMNIPSIAKWAGIKGIQIMGTGDFTHPEWLNELKSSLKPVGYGTFEYEGVKFFLTAEVSNIFYRRGEGFKVHNIILAPDFETVEKIICQISGYGKLASDGRPILVLDPEELVKIVLEASVDSMVIPAHVWTPHFGVFGSASGFDSLPEGFGSQSKNIFAIETGLSSNPAMNWRLSALDNISLISNSDAHSPRKLGREANVFALPDSTNLYAEITKAIKTKDRSKFLYTIEFFPEEGKYHFDGHRLCAYRAHPQETIAQKLICPVCKKPVTVGVLHRVEELADRKLKTQPSKAIPFKSLIPLAEIIAEVLGVGRSTQKVEKEYFKLITRFGNEFTILMDTEIDELSKYTSAGIAAGIDKMRKGDVEINPGYDGEFGIISLAR
ncbi:MAG: DNA helicase UvrD [Elusimicrobia bacterium]|nr:DNA helicase UvrD [Elusimicrobiota bacterium]